jgi:hypothetical protein
LSTFDLTLALKHSSMVKTNGSAGFAGAGSVFICFLGGVLLRGIGRYNILNLTPKTVTLFVS